MKRTNIIVADDDKAIRVVLETALKRSGYDVSMTENAAGLWGLVQENFADLIITDVVMPDENAFDLIPKIKKLNPNLPIIVMSAQNTLMTAITANELGAFDYLPKPFDIKELLSIVNRAVSEKNKSNEKISLDVGEDIFPLIGRSKPMQEIYRVMARLMHSDLTVLITGESGTGKELIAKALHEFGDRKDSTFVPINMAAIPRELIESELFGHEKGAFTSAIKQRKGKFETADGGTLFLDEVGDMSLKAQAKVLRALQEHKITRVGSDKTITINVRVLAATNKDLKKEIEKGNFREDLYHRLGVILINNPSLDERKEDIPILTKHFNKEICKEHGIAEKIFDKDALEKLMSYSWSGNIREFRNVIERLIILCSETVNKEDVESFAGKQ
jgi:two-component system nitrogen regulation response regulator GlnG